MDIDKEKESCCIIVNSAMKEIGVMIKGTAMVMKSLQMGLSMKESIKITKCMGRVSTVGQEVKFMKENGLIT